MSPTPTAYPEDLGAALASDYALCRAHWDLAALEEGAAKALMRLALHSAHHAALPPAPILPPPMYALPPARHAGNCHHCLPPAGSHKGKPALWPSPEALAPRDEVPRSIDVHFASDGRILEHEDPDGDLSLFLGAEHFWGVGHPSHKDLAHVSAQDVAVIADDPDNAATFPVLLHTILSCGMYRDAIAWLPHGRAFAVVDEKRFFGEVCPTYFCTSDPGMFLQLVEASGFAAVESPWLELGALAFCHERFLQHRPWLACTMKPFLRCYVQHCPRGADRALGAYLGMLPPLPPLPPTLAPIEAPKLVRHTSA